MREYFIRKNGEPWIDNQLRVRFSVQVYPGSTLALAEINIYNLANSAELRHGDSIELIAGYKNRSGVVFKGTVINMFRERDGADIFHRVIARTSTVETRGSASSTYGEGAQILDVLEDIAKAWPLRLDVNEKQFEGEPPFTSGLSLDGDLPTILNALAREYNFQWVEHVGRLVIMKEGEIDTDASAVKISQMTGMEGIPEINRGPYGLGVTVMKRLDPFIFPNTMIEIETGFTSFNTGNVYFGEVPADISANGVYNVLSLVHSGDTHGDTWTTEINGLRREGTMTHYNAPSDGSLAWGRVVSQEFRVRAREVADSVRIDPNFLMAVIAFETGGTFDPSIRNAAGSGATGLIQFMPNTATGLGTTTAQLARMSAVEQLDYVEKYFRPYRGRMNTLSDVYMAVLWPAAVGKPGSDVLFKSPSIQYRQNAGLDVNRNGEITKDEATAKVAEKLEQGLRNTG